MTHYHYPPRTPSTPKLPSQSHNYANSMASSNLTNSSPSILSQQTVHSSSPILRRNTRISFTPATPSSSLPVTPHHHPSRTNLLERVLSSPSSKLSIQSTLHSDNKSLYRKLVQTGIPLTPNKLSKAINQLISEKKLKPRMPTSVQHPIGLKRPSDYPERPPTKKIRIESAPDGSASLVLSSEPNHTSRPWLTPTTTRTASHPPSLSSKTRTNQPHPRVRSTPVYHQSSLVSADIQDYGRVAIKKEALIDKLGFEAAQLAIHKARSTRQRPKIYQPRRAQSPPSPQNASSRTNRIKRWLDSADHDEDELVHSSVRTGLALITQPRGLLDPLTTQTEAESEKTRSNDRVEACTSDPQTLFWSPLKSTTTQPASNRSAGKASDPELELRSVLHSLSPGTHRSSRPFTLIDRPITPPNQQSFFRFDLQNKPDNFGSFSHLSLSQLEPPSSMNTMLKPGCNLHQSFLSLAPSPTIILSGSDALGGAIQNDENRPHTTKSEADPRHPLVRLTPAGNRSRQSSSSFRSSKNDFPPCSPVRPEVAKLMEQQSRSKSPNDYNGVLEKTFFDSYSSDQSTDHSWLAELDPNRERLNPHPQSHRPHSSNYTHFPSLTSSPNFLDDQNFFEDFLAFSSG